MKIEECFINVFNFFLDINECDAIPGLCLGGECVNTIGSFICKCPKGQARDEVTNMCRDIDECAEQGACENGYCINTDGSYYCTCHPGFIRNTEMTGCIGTFSSNALTIAQTDW